MVDEIDERFVDFDIQLLFLPEEESLDIMRGRELATGRYREFKDRINTPLRRSGHSAEPDSNLALIIKEYEKSQQSNGGLETTKIAEEGIEKLKESMRKIRRVWSKYVIRDTQGNLTNQDICDFYEAKAEICKNAWIHTRNPRLKRKDHNAKSTYLELRRQLNKQV